MTPPPTTPGRLPLLERYCDWVGRRHRLVLLLALACSAAATWTASHLELRTNVAELLPSRDPAVEELNRTGRKIGGTQVLEVAVESPDRAANLRFAGELTRRLHALPPGIIQMVAFEVQGEKKFFADRKWLYADLPLLTALRDGLRGQLEHAKNPLLVDLDEPETPEQLVARFQAKRTLLDTFPTGYFEGDWGPGKGPGSIVAVVIRPPGDLFGERVGERLLAETSRIIAELQPPTFHKDLRVGLTGPVMAQLEERAALENDLAWATGICVLLVCAAVILFYGRVRSVLYLAIPALLGVAVAFACAQLLFGYLNTSTAFMGSIIVGNGINFAIIQMARYEEERRAGMAVREATVVALGQTVRATAIAALGAAIAYGSLTVTRFRGFSQFGVIGGIGMVMAWVATVALLPALWAAFDRRSARLRRFSPPLQGAFSELVSRLATRAPRALLVVSLVLTVVAAVPIHTYLRDPFEYDFNNLRNRRSFESGAAALAPRVDRIFGETLTPAVIVADKREHTEEIRSVIFERDKALPGESMIGSVRTIDDFLPGSRALQEQKIALLGELRELCDDPALKLLGDEERKKIRELRPPEGLTPIAAEELPEAIRQPFTEVDEEHALGRIVLVYHQERFSTWDGRNLMRMADIIGEMQLHDGTVVRSSGHAVIFAAMIRSIAHDAPLATAASFLGVALLVMALARGRRGAVLVIVTLCAGVLWMLGAAAWAGVRTNFLNFIALPITFGIGVDYGINIYLRYRIEGRGRVGRAVRATGGAVALCSLTTIIGYGALLVADNQALRSFGKMAILGEVACLLAAVAVMPAFLVWAERRRKPGDDITSRRRRAPAK
ncbi:MAG: hypothetical protein EXR72_23720 [Myxococcales bacterium]|nr:hypothetical protein [Myxococcales bacterium]